jgi:hypothetical protein
MRMIALAAALAVLPTVAHAAKLTLGQGVNDTLPIVGATDSWTFYLRKGQDYAVEYLAKDDSQAAWTLRAPSGSVLKRWQTAEDESYGFAFRAPATGTYRLDGRAVEIEQSDIISYYLRVAKDCRNKLPTTCYINVGATQTRWADYGYDIDYVRLAGLTAGRTYTVSLVNNTYEGSDTIRLVNGQGTVLGQGPSITFKAPATTLYVRFEEDNDSGGGPYKLTLKPSD